MKTRFSVARCCCDDTTEPIIIPGYSIVPYQPQFGDPQTMTPRSGPAAPTVNRTGYDWPVLRFVNVPAGDLATLYVDINGWYSTIGSDLPMDFEFFPVLVIDPFTENFDVSNLGASNGVANESVHPYPPSTDPPRVWTTPNIATAFNAVRNDPSYDPSRPVLIVAKPVNIAFTPNFVDNRMLWYINPNREARYTQ